MKKTSNEDNFLDFWPFLAIFIILPERNFAGRIIKDENEHSDVPLP